MIRRIGSWLMTWRLVQWVVVLFGLRGLWNAVWRLQACARCGGVVVPGSLEFFEEGGEQRGYCIWCKAIAKQRGAVEVKRARQQRLKRALGRSEK